FIRSLFINVELQSERMLEIIERLCVWMSKERLEEAKKWIGQMRLILSTKTDKDEIAYVQSKIDLFEWMIEQVEQNNRYRNLLESISTTNKVASEIFSKKDGKTLIGPDDILQEILRKVNEELEETEDA